MDDDEHVAGAVVDPAFVVLAVDTVAVNKVALSVGR
jgi:hypothetical protein